ncbi:protoheme IX farnesyltransferase [Aspergillus clavatus NRRL 1]|uniref:Protoheme IX farnesyltransferase, mitochondrial n=1 Tax=Aspergillus clavatus (strain ATCC 1007 / CBS 513.65 / DSM 816 / NCTC 3887 / NRRL 1 / QM 1276 / 107) TaxID=344612 RepID=A1CHE7_ASPCL|nr:heme a biosynthesis protein, putative [Aspergillus clavatus NRRL 1]EAW10302.1 heme a biosynthesis protein, putative [Aspergillus clavatus NRRL 1]
MILLRSSLLRPGSTRDSARLCSKCFLRVSHPQRPAAARSFLSSSRPPTGIADRESPSLTAQKAYFSANRTTDSLSAKNGLLASLSDAHPSAQPSLKTTPTESAGSSGPVLSESTTEELPHRRRKRLKEELAKNDDTESVIPPDASSQLSSLSSALPATSLRRKLAAFLALTKPRLSFLIVLTTTSAYGMYPISSLLTLDPSMTPLPTLSTSTLTFLYLTAGTFLSSCSANTINMLLEPKYDAQMSRTKNRPLVRGLVSTRGAIFFAIATAVLGLTLLYIGTNPTTTALSASNICLYAFVYTPLKRISVINTWVGAVVGGIPPLMGWTAAAGQTATTGHDSWQDMLFSKDSIGGWLLGGILFAWQFPHFNALSYTIREEYKAAGYRMLAWTNPAANARVALRYSIMMFPISIGLWWVGVVGHGFLVGSTVANGWLVKEAYRFWQHQGANGSARSLFWASIWQLPILLVGGLVTKKGLWDGVWNNIFGQPEEDEGEFLYYEDEDEEVETKSSSELQKPRSS